MKFNPNNPYNNLPDLPPKADIESKKILKACIEARSALAELKVAGYLIPNQSILINTLPLLEAKSSSEIENIVTTTDKLFQYSNLPNSVTDSATKEALNYRTALFNGFKSISKRPICTSTAIEICSTIKNKVMDIRKVPGTQIKNISTNKTIYTPPEGADLIRTKLSNWEKFLHEKEEIDILIRMAICHYQFESIHPFTDGNGRTGRIINILILVEKGLLDIPSLYLSKYILKNRVDYYKLLNNVTRNDAWEEWILYMLDAVKKTSIWTVYKINTIIKLMYQTKEYLRKKEPQFYTKELLDILFVQPYCRINNLVESNIAKRQTASEYLKKISDIGILKEVKTGREKVFINTRLMDLLLKESNEIKPFK